MVHQARATGGMWFRYGGLSGVIDPGPGSLVHMRGASPALDPHLLRAIVLTHKHLDHSTDINVVAEAMTRGGFEKQGAIIIPDDSVNGSDPVLLKYMARKVGRVCVCADGERISFEEGVTVEPVAHIHHGVDCFGMIFRKTGLPTWGILSDTRPLDHFPERYGECAYLSLNVTFPNKKKHLDHMSAEDAAELLGKLRPKLATLTHLGMVMLENDPDAIAKSMGTNDTRVLAARDGMVIDLDSLQVTSPVKEKYRESLEAEYEIIY